MVCHTVAEKFNSGKTAAADILKNAKKLRTDYGFFQGNLQKKRRNERYHLIHEAVYIDAIKMFSSKYFPDVAFLQEGALIIKNVSSKKGIR